jgi:proteasome accessory factor A
MQRRPLVNTRDEPHADPARWRRFHVICGDANLSPYATYLKVGATAAVLAALEQIDPDSIPELEDPVGAMREISRDAGWQWPCDLADGRYSSAIEVQRRYLELVRASGVECGDGFRLGDWEGALEDLERDPYALADRLDWVAKHRLIAAFREEHNIGEEDPWLMSLDLSYHLLDEQEGLFFALKDQGQWQLPLGLENDPEPLLEAPRETRAAVRGRCIARFGDVVESAQWDHVTLSSEGLRLRLELGGLFGAESVKEALAVVEAAADLRDLLALPFAKIVEGG